MTRAEDPAPAPLAVAARALARCVVRASALLARRRIAQPTDHLHERLEFADGTRGRVYRETVVRDAPQSEPALLVVAFRLRWVRGRGHAIFRAESLLNTILFAGFPGLVSKLWLAHDENGVYRGFYQWDHATLAVSYVQALWWVLALVSERGSIHSVVLPGVGRDDVLADPTILDRVAPAGNHDEWWRLVATVRSADL